MQSELLSRINECRAAKERLERDLLVINARLEAYEDALGLLKAAPPDSLLTEPGASLATGEKRGRRISSDWKEVLSSLRKAGRSVFSILITHHPQPRVPCQAPVNPRFERVVHALGTWLPIETRAGIEATDKANSLRKAPTH